MARTMSPTERRAELDRRLDRALDVPDGTCLELARSSIQTAPDRWYGQLLSLSHDSVAAGGTASAVPGSDEPAAAGGTASTAAASGDESVAAASGDASTADVVLPAATAVELLRGYCRLRGELLVQLENDAVHSPSRAPSASLLAGDYLNSAAYAELGSVDHARLGAAFETLLSLSESLACAFDAGYPRSVEDHCSFLDETAGSLGEGAAAIGARFAGADESTRERLATVGRESSTARQIQRRLDSESAALPDAPRDVDEHQLRQHAERRVDAAARALDELAPAADVEALRAFVASSLTGFDSPL